MIVGYFLQEFPASLSYSAVRAKMSAGKTPRDETVGGRDEFDGCRGLRVSVQRLIRGEPLKPLRS